MPARSASGPLTVAAWIRMRIPAPPAPVMLTSGPPPPAEPPLAELRFRPVPTDPRPRFFVSEEELPDGTLLLSWNADDPEHLDAELRVESAARHVGPEVVARFWEAVRDHVRDLAPVQVEGADPAPPARTANAPPR